MNVMQVMCGSCTGIGNQTNWKVVDLNDNRWLSGFDFSVLMHRFLISEGGYVIDAGNYENVNAEVALRLAEKIKKHPKLWQWFFMVA